MATYDLAEIEALWIINGGSAEWAPMAASIAMAESRGNSDATHRNSNGSIDRGLFQINSVHGNLSTTNLVENIKAAIKISNNGRDWNPWTTYKSGAYKKYIDQARKLVGTVRAEVKAARSHGNANAGLGIPGLDQAAGQLTQGFGQVTSAVNAVGSGLSAVGRIADLVTSASFWLRLGEALLGVILLAMGLRSLTGNTTSPASVVTAAAKAVPK